MIHPEVKLQESFSVSVEQKFMFIYSPAAFSGSFLFARFLIYNFISHKTRFNLLIIINTSISLYNCEICIDYVYVIEGFITSFKYCKKTKNQIFFTINEIKIKTTKLAIIIVFNFDNYSSFSCFLSLSDFRFPSKSFR